MGVQLSTTARNSRLAVVKSANDNGVTNISQGTMKVYTGGAAGIANSVTGTLLVTLTAVTIATASGGQSVVSATAGTAVAGGTPGYARFADVNGVAYMEVDCAVSGGTISFNQAISLGGLVSLTSGVLTEGNA